MKQIICYLQLILVFGTFGCRSRSELSVPESFVRVDDKSIETAELRTKIADGREVTLIGVIHVGSELYYKELNRELKNYDLVFFELLGWNGKTGLPPFPKSRRDHILQNRLGLFYQGTIMDFSSEQFRHGDLSAEKLATLKQKATTNTADGQAKLVAILSSDGTSDDRLLQLLHDQNARKTITQGIEYPEELLEARYTKLVEQLKSPEAKEAKHIAILYGASHLPAIYNHLPGPVPVSLKWREAWEVQSLSNK